MKLTVFTTTFGDTDPLRQPSVVANRVRYVCFTDVSRRPQVPPYEWVYVPLEADDDPALVSRRLKILANHPALHAPEITLWHDAAFQLRCDPRALAMQELRDGVDLLAFAHPDRTRIEDEAEVIGRIGYMPLARVRAQAAAYRAAGFPMDQRAITSTGFCLRRMTPQIRAFNAAWWREVDTWGWRDQMSVDYALWKTGVVPHYIPGHYRDNPYARWHKYTPPLSVRPHRRDRDVRPAVGVPVV